ncbi:MAG: metal-dependent hydrolase [Clostridia bacterium]|nr:metal-dependent hydrolase [Clostridia bacterium]
MLGYAHLSTGLMATAIAVGHGALPLDSGTVIGSVVGSIILDIDESHSMVNKIIFPFNFLRNILGKLLFYGGLSAASFYSFYQLGFEKGYLLGILFLIITLSGHREIIHSIPGLIGITVLLCLIFKIDNTLLLPKSFIISFVFNGILHLLLDLFNKAGVKLFAPFSNKTLRYPICAYSNSTKARFIELAICMSLFTYILLNKNIFIELL